MAADKPSKSARKRDYLALQALGERLVGLSESQLRDIGLEENLYDAVVAAARIRSRGARRRQFQLIGKLMRNVDPEPIRLALDALQRQANTDKEIFRQAEYWRDRIVERGQDGLQEYSGVTGKPSNELSSLLKEYVATPGDSAKRALRRKIFRQLHEELTVQSSAS